MQPVSVPLPYIIYINIYSPSVDNPMDSPMDGNKFKLLPKTRCKNQNKCLRGVTPKSRFSIASLRVSYVAFTGESAKREFKVMLF